MKKPELLAPAGDLEKLKIALAYGADAVYFGGRDYGLRANATNFSIDEIKEAVIIAHKLKKRIYVTVNIVFHEEDIIGLDDYLKALDEINVDAIMISDPLVLERVKKLGLKLEIYLSTQTSTLNYETVKFWENLGVKRVVLAREAHKEDIIRIKKETNMQVECFIHGAMCTAFSGKCVLSNHATLRDANRGGCAQICRWVFNTDDYKEKFSMTPKDLNMVTFIEDMMMIGVDSLKVEGRMRSVYYIATVILTYRNIIDKCFTNTLTEEYTKYYLNILYRCANRESAPQFFDKLPTFNEQYFQEREEVSNQDFLGIIKHYDDNTKMAIVEERNLFKIGDEVEAFGPLTPPTTFKIEQIYDEEDNKIDIARHPKMLVKISTPVPLKVNDMLRIKVFDI